MKKVFPLIIILISLSLIGIIIIQVNWFKNQLVVQQERFLDKVEKVAEGVAEELSQQATSPYGLSRRNGLQPFPDNLSFSILKPSTISDKFTAAEISDKINKAFKKEGLENLRHVA